MYNSQSTTIDIETLTTQILVLKRFNLDAAYQRGIVWDDAKQSLFINSVVIGIIPTPLIFVDNANNTQGTKTVIDGKQRITSILRFVNNEIYCELNDKKIYYDKIPLSNNIDFVNYRVMNDIEKSKFKNTNLNCITYLNIRYEDELLIFNRIQNGAPISDGDLLIASVKNETSNISLNSFYESLVNVIGKYNNNNTKEKNNHVILITNIMYMVYFDKLKNYTKADRILAIDKYEENTDLLRDMVNTIIIDVFTHLNKSDKKLCNYMLYPYIYHRYKSDKLIENINEYILNIKNNVTKKEYKNVYDFIKSIY